MAVKFEESSRQQALIDVAERMMLAARTAPKAKGVDNLVVARIGREEIERISDTMEALVRDEGAFHSFERDAQNILESEVIVLIGTRIRSVGVPFCGLCGHKDCDEKNRHPSQPCAFNIGDLGIAVGSAVSVAMDARVDNRIMYTVGIAARRLNLLGEDVGIIYGIPLSSTSKNPFFDRKD